MLDQEVHVIGEEDIVLMLGLLGLKGTVIENREEFLEIFNNLINQQNIGMIIIALKLSNEMIDFLLDFKLDNRSPFVFILPDAFQPNIEKEDIILNKMFDAISDIVS